MSDIDNKSLCREAELYYLSVIFGPEFGEIPEKLSRHIEVCPDCQRFIADLKNNLNTEKNTKTSADKDLLQSKLKTLEEHLSHTGKEINCSAVKPYLPLLLVQDFEVSVPTPITAHLDNCQGCQKDLAAVKSLCLKQNQLEVLSRFLSSQDSVEQDCPAAEIIRSYADFDFKAVPAEALKHIENCSLCQILAYQIRKKKLENLKNKKSGTFLMCNDVSFAALFDYCLSSQATIRQGLNIEHISQCPKCLDKIQLLHTIILEIKQKPQSGVATKYQLTKLTTSDKTSIYDGFPVQVQTVISADKQKSLGKNKFRKALKYISRGAVAAVVLFAIAIFIHTATTATAIDAEQILEAIQNAPSIHKIRYSPETSEPIEEEWVSKSLNIYILKTSKGISVWNVSNSRFLFKPENSAIQEISIVPETVLAAVREKIRSSAELIPFKNLTPLPPDAKWKKLNNQTSEDFEVYELSWTGQTKGGILIPNKWLTYINIQTKLPEKAELFMKLPDDSDYKMTDLSIIEYASNDEILRVFQEFDLDDALLGAP